MFLLTLDGRLHLAPIENMPGGVHNVLDIATGTGIWAIEFAAQYPSASVIGTDLSPIQPAFVPPNCRFEVDDADDPWLYSQKFDYIHMRAVTTCFRSHREVIKSAYAHTRPGGYLEFQDGFMPVMSPDDTMKGSAIEEWDRKIAAGARALGKDWQQTTNYKSYMEEAGYVDVLETKFAWPVGPWAKDPKLKTLGLWGRENFMSMLQGASMAVMTRGLGMSPQEVEVFLAEVRAEANSRKVHFYAPIYFIYGRKPEDAV
jgi:SAM-dependent methyltransferase